MFKSPLGHTLSAASSPTGASRAPLIVASVIFLAAYDPEFLFELAPRVMSLAELDHLYGDRMQPDIEGWDPWHPGDCAARREGADSRGLGGGGGAIDLFLGTPTRDQEDLEIAVASSFFETLPPRFPSLTSGSRRASAS